MTPEEMEAFRAAIGAQAPDAGVPQFAPAPGETRYLQSATPAADPRYTDPGTGTDGSALGTHDEMLSRLRNYGTDFVNNPAVRALGASSTPMSGPLSQAIDYGAQRAGIGRREPVFQREAEGGPQMMELRPMQAGPSEQVQPVAPLQNPVRQTAIGAAGGSMGGGGGMGGLMGRLRGAQHNQLNTLDEQKDLVEQRGDLVAERVDSEAKMQELAAARMKRDAEVMQEHQKAAEAKHEAFLQRNQQLADDIGAQKIDPGRLMQNTSAAGKIGMAISGFLAGVGGQGPAFMQRIDNMVGEDVKAQIANVDNKKSALAGRQSLFAQMMQESGDRRVAEAQTRNLIYESVKQDLAAKSARLGIPEIQNSAAMTAKEIQSSKQDPLQTQIATENLRNAQAAAAAAAAAQRQAEERMWSHSMQVGEMALKKDELDIKRGELDLKRGDGLGLGQAGREAMALDAAKTQRELAANLRAVSAADPKAIAAGTTAGEAWSHLPTVVPGVDTARENVNAREAYNALVRPGVGAAWKMRTGGVEPKNPTILEEQARAFMVKPTDDEATVKDRQARFRKHMIESAEAQGAEAPALPDSLKFAGAKK